MLFLQFSARVDLTLYGTSHTEDDRWNGRNAYGGFYSGVFYSTLLPLDFLYCEFTLALIGVVTCIVERVLSAENNYA